MKIKKMHLMKYKRFSDLTIDLGDNPKRIVALVGPNGCGKSSVFDAMLYIQNAYGRIGNSGVKDYKYHSLEHEPNYNYKNISIEFLLGKYSDVYNQKKAGGKERTRKLYSKKGLFKE